MATNVVIVSNTVPQAQGVEAEIPVWKKIDWSPEIEQGIYKDWGKYYSRRCRETIAMNYYDKALEMAPEDYITLYNRSQSNRQTANTKMALLDSTEARSLAQRHGIINAPINLEVCDGLYELNQLENAKAELHDNMRLFKGNKVKAFKNRLVVIDENIKDTCGVGLGPFILQNEKLMYHVKKLIDVQSKIDDRPLWETLSKQSKCDILSIPEIEEEIFSPLEVARRNRAFDIFNQVFVDESWIDVLFLKNLRKNPDLLLEQCKHSRDVLSTLLEEQYGVVKKFLKMIYARSPMYHIRYKKHANNELFGKFNEDLLFRIQYQTRRNMFATLRTIKKLRKEQDIEKLSNYVEEVMGNYVVLKTNRIMPWKFEFINEVYNTLALTLFEQYYLRKDPRPEVRDSLLNLLHQHKVITMDTSTFVFGDRTTHQTDDLLDSSILKSRRLIARFEKRMLFAKYSIEKCYILHQIANIHLNGNRQDECCFIARKAIEECKNCNNNLWKFLANMIIVKSNASLRKIEGTKEALAHALETAKLLKSPQMIEFMELCINCNDVLCLIPKGVSSSASRRSSKTSARSSDLSQAH